MTRYRFLAPVLLTTLLVLGLVPGTEGLEHQPPADAKQPTVSGISDIDELLTHLLVQGNDEYAEELLEAVQSQQEDQKTKPSPQQPDKQILPKELPAQPMTKGLPSRVDNSTSKYFPPILQQVGGSCAQVAGIQNVFCYEINYLRDLDARQSANQYPAHFTWLCLNNAEGKGSSGVGGWTIARELGIPTLDTYSSRYGFYKSAGWMSGYDKYFQAMHNRIESYGVIRIKTPTDLEKAKRWLHNHNDPNQKVGGLLYFSMLSKNRKSVKIPKGEYEAGKTLFTAWGNEGGHAMTYIGYDDNVGYDINGDGKITNNIDINGDGKVTLADWERGAFLFADSKGTRFADKGKAYVMYRLCALPKSEGGGGSSAMWVKPRKTYQPTLTMKLTFAFNDRSALRLSAGIAANPDAGSPAKTFKPGLYNGRYRVGGVPMRGKDNQEPIEIGLDISQFAEYLKSEKSAKFFLTFARKPGTAATGEVLAASVLQYENGELLYEQPFAIEQGAFGDSPLELTAVYDPKITTSQK